MTTVTDSNPKATNGRKPEYQSPEGDDHLAIYTGQPAGALPIAHVVTDGGSAMVGHRERVKAAAALAGPDYFVAPRDEIELPVRLPDEVAALVGRAIWDFPIRSDGDDNVRQHMDDLVATMHAKWPTIHAALLGIENSHATEPSRVSLFGEDLPDVTERDGRLVAGYDECWGYLHDNPNWHLDHARAAFALHLELVRRAGQPTGEASASLNDPPMPYAIDGDGLFFAHSDKFFHLDGRASDLDDMTDRDRAMATAACRYALQRGFTSTLHDPPHIDRRLPTRVHDGLWFALDGRAYQMDAPEHISVVMDSRAQSYANGLCGLALRRIWGQS